MNYFSEYELTCRCGCGKQNMDEQFLNKLNIARDNTGIPFVITSASRCEKHNKEVGVSPNSSHLKGLAVDIATKSSRERFLILSSLMNVGLNRIGIANNFIHVDYDTDKVQNVIWVY